MGMTSLALAQALDINESSLVRILSTCVESGAIA
jgi:DNA-binding IclR family transcriptional regulator